jgi:DNA-binding transcriptional LysR family regulator
MVVQGAGISILPARTMRAEIAQGRMVAVKLHAPGLVRPVGVVHRRRKKLNRAAQAFVELLVEQTAAKEERRQLEPAEV